MFMDATREVVSILSSKIRHRGTVGEWGGWELLRPSRMDRTAYKESQTSGQALLGTRHVHSTEVEEDVVEEYEPSAAENVGVEARDDVEVDDKGGIGTKAFLHRAPLSFFDDFQVINGIPAFILEPNERLDGGHEQMPSTSNEIQAKFPASFTCSCVSNDGKRMITGDSSGTARLWDIDHGKVLGIFSGPLRGEAAACCFLDGSNDSVLVSDNEGTICQFTLGSGPREGFISQCNAAANRLCQLHEGSNAIQEALNQDTRVPRLYPPVFSNTGRKVAQALSIRTTIRRMFPEIHIFVHDVCDAPPTVDGDGQQRAILCAGQCIEFEISRSLVSSCMFSPDGEGLMIVCSPIPPNEHYEGRDIESECHVIVWPNLKYPQHSVMLPGRFGKWSDGGEWIITWTLSEEGINNAVRIFDSTELLNDMVCGMVKCVSKEMHPRFCCRQASLLLKPKWPNLLWCELISPDSSSKKKVSTFPKTIIDRLHPDFSGWKLATCIGVPEDNNLRVVVWDLKNLARLFVLDTGVNIDSILKSARYKINIPEARHLEWGMRHYNLEQSLCKIAVSRDSRWVAFYCGESNTGIMWRLDWGVPVLKINVSDDLLEDKWNTSRVLHFDKQCSRMVLTGAGRIVVYLPSILTLPSISGPQMRNVVMDTGKQNELVLEEASGSALSDESGSSANGVRDASSDEGYDEEQAQQLTYSKCTLSHDGSVLAIRGQMGRLFGGTMREYGPLFWGIRSDQIIDLKKRCDTQLCFTLSLDGSHFALLNNEGNITVGQTGDCGRDATSSVHREIRHDPKWRISSLCFSKDTDGTETLVAFSRQRRGMIFWFDINRMCETQRKDAGLRGCRSIRYCQRGTQAVITNLQNILIWDLVARSVSARIDFKVNISQAQQKIMFKMMSQGTFGMKMNTEPLISSDGQIVVLLWDKEQSKPIITHPGITLGELEESFAKSSGNFSTDFLISEDARWAVVAESVVPVEGADVVRRISIFDVWGRCPPRELRDWKYSSIAAQIFTISSDGRMVVSKSVQAMEQDGLRWSVDDLNCWTPYSCEACLPDYDRIILNNRGKGEEVIEQLLSDYGWAVINNNDHQGMSIFCHAVADGNLGWVAKILEYAKAENVAVGMHWVDKNSGINTSALNYAIEDRSMELSKFLVEGVLDGGTSCIAAAHMFKESLLPLGTVFPGIFQEVLEDNMISKSSGQLVVPSEIFESSSVGYLVGTDDATPQWEEMTESQLVDAWVQMVPGLRGALKREGPRVYGKSSWVVNADIAQVGLKGILRPLLMQGFPSETFGFAPVRWTIEYKWNAYARRLSLISLAYYIVFVLLFSTYAYVLGERDDPTRDWYKSSLGVLGIITMITSAIMALVDLRHECRQIYQYWKDGGREGLTYWAQSFWNWMDFLSYGLVLVILLVEIIDNDISKLETLGVLVPITAIMLWAKFLYYAQAFQVSGPMVIMITEIVKDMMVFSFLLLLVVIGFGIAFYVLFSLDPGSRSGEGDEGDEGDGGDEGGDDETGFETLQRSLLSMFTLMLGDFEIDVFTGLDLWWLGLTFFILYMITIMIILLNLLIAIMGDTFDRVKGTEDTQFLLGRADVIDDVEAMLSQQEKDRIEGMIGKYLHVLEPVDDSQGGAGEWKGKVLEMEKQMSRLINDANDNLAGNLKEQIEQLRDEIRTMANRN